MKAEFKAKWVAALRSGEYQQGRNRLRDGEKFCCLGVARELIEQKSNLRLKDEDVLCREHSKLIGLPSTKQRTLVEMNDAGRTFAQIADYIEARL